MDTTVLRYEEEWLVINDSEKGNCLYLQNKFSKILKIEIEDFSNIHLKYKNNLVNKVIVESVESALILPETVWEETIAHGENTYVIAFERISLAYYTGSDLYGNKYEIIRKALLLLYKQTNLELMTTHQLREIRRQEMIEKYEEGMTEGINRIQLLFLIKKEQES